MLARILGNRESEVRDASLSWPDYEAMFNNFSYNGIQYQTNSHGYASMSALNGAKNPIVAACIHVRTLVFSEARFTFQRYSASRPGDMFGDPSLTILEKPYPSATTGDLLARMEVDASLYGNSYWIVRDGILVRLDPTKVMIATGSVSDQITGGQVGQQLIGYHVHGDDGEMLASFEPSQVAHYRPLPDPNHAFRGVSWLNAVMPDVRADTELTAYKHAFLSNAATPNMVVSFDPSITREAFDKFKESMESKHRGTSNAYKTMYLGGGADVKVVGSNFEQIAMKAVQGAGETRIAAAAGVPASILGISEGLSGSSLNAGNYTAARRRFADGTLRPLWRSACGALQTLVPPPDGSARLWYDDRDVSFLQEDVADNAEIRMKDAQTMRTLVDGGFEPTSVVAAVTTGDMARLVHTGSVSVQLQPLVP